MNVSINTNTPHKTTDIATKILTIRSILFWFKLICLIAYTKDSLLIGYSA